MVIHQRASGNNHDLKIYELQTLLILGLALKSYYKKKGIRSDNEISQKEKQKAPTTGLASTFERIYKAIKRLALMSIQDRHKNPLKNMPAYVNNSI